MANPFLSDGPARARRVLVLAHGAGAPMDSEFMQTIAEGVAAAGIRVVRFEFPYMAARRADGRKRGPDRQPALEQAWRDAVTRVGNADRLVIGGKSLGGRIASLIADELGVRGLVCLGYPFHPPGRPEKTRTAHLADLRTETLILQGERDPFGTRDEVAGYDLSKRIRVEWLPDGDHSLKPRVRSGHTEQQNLARAVDATVAFVRATGSDR